MPPSPWYRQCELERASDLGTERTVSWLPESQAVIGKVVGLKHDGQWREGWKILTVGAHRICEKEAVSLRDNYRHQRKASDV